MMAGFTVRPISSSRGPIFWPFAHRLLYATGGAFAYVHGRLYGKGGRGAFLSLADASGDQLLHLSGVLLTAPGKYRSFGPTSIPKRIIKGGCGVWGSFLRASRFLTSS